MDASFDHVNHLNFRDCELEREPRGHLSNDKEQSDMLPDLLYLKGMARAVEAGKAAMIEKVAQ